MSDKDEIVEGEFVEKEKPESDAAPIQLVPVEQTADDLALMPVMDMALATERYKQMRAFVTDLMIEDKDFGVIPGTGKPTLLKPGAEKLLTFFGLSKVFRLIDSIEHWDPTLEQTRDPEYVPIFYYRYRCTLTRKGIVIADGEGSCSSLEDRYRWRWVQERYIPDGIDKERLRSRDGTITEFEFAYEKRQTSGEWGKPEEYWKKFDEALESKTARRIKKITRAGKTYDALQIGGELYRIPNPDVHSLVNTIQKMAQKRAMIGATLPAVNASEFFTQDVEDMSPQAVSGTDEGQEAGNADDQDGKENQGDGAPTVDQEMAQAESPKAAQPAPAPATQTTKTQETTSTKARKYDKQWDDGTVNALRESSFKKGTHANQIRNTLAYSPFRDGDPMDWIEEWVSLYGEQRFDEEGETLLETPEAAGAATGIWARRHQSEEGPMKRLGEEWFEKWLA